MRWLMICFVSFVCISFVSPAQAQDDDHYGTLAQEFLKAYFSSDDPSRPLPIPMAHDFMTESVFCSDIPPTKFEALPLDERYSDMEFFMLIKRIGTDQGVLYVVFREFEGPDTVEDVVQHVFCEDSPAGRALKAVITNEIVCDQGYPAYTWIAGHWTNREGNRALLRFHSMYHGDTIFVYLKKEGDEWTYDKGICGYDAAGQALSLITEYMYDYPDSFYFIGSMDTPVFVEITSARGGYDTKQATILVQLETVNESNEAHEDPACVIQLRRNPGWLVYEMRCAPN